GPTLRLDLTEALATACRQNREFLARREGLYRAGLSIALTRFEFGPQFAAAVNYLWRNSELGGEAQRSGGSVSASQILPTGGRVSVSAGLDADWLDGTSQAFFGTNTGISLTQPLLRGAGPEIAYEALTQAERGLVYAVREFELFRQGFSIQIAQQFFGLSSQRQTLANGDRNYENAVFDTRKAEALQQVGRNSEQEVFRARRREIDAKDQLINARATYDRAVDNFSIVLGLPTTTDLELADVEPPYEPVRFEVTSAIAAARANRLDLLTGRQRLQDTERALRIAENGLLPDLSLTANYGTAGSGDDLGVAAPDQWSSSIGLSLGVPLQRKAQRNSYRSALIALEQARRGLQQTEDQLELDIRDAVRRLRSTEERIALQEAQIVQEERAQTVIQIRYDAGTADNRDLFEARQALIDARNALIRLKVEHFIARLSLQKDMGIFFVDDRGMWR
ncbi:MAG: TolC family protein, partial [Planctomycetota bacterium]